MTRSLKLRWNLPSHDKRKLTDMSGDLAFASIAELGRRLRNREVTVVQLTEFCLDRLARFGSEYHAVAHIDAAGALEEAKIADRELASGHDRGPLHGIPYGAKDLLATKGIPTSWGATPFKDQLFDHDATVIKRLREAGAILCAKLAMVELAGGFGYRQADAAWTGPGLNPWDKSRWSGGSSSGSATAVGCGLVPFAIGSETMGSIMTPAGYCGVSGLRPTYGRVSRHGAMALSWTMDKLGPICRTAADCGQVLQAIAGPDPADETSLSQSWSLEELTVKRKFRFARVKYESGQVDSTVQQNFDAAVDVLAQFGTVEAIELPELPYSVVGSTIISCEMAAAFEPFIVAGQAWELTAPEDRWGAYSNLLIPAKDYINALRIRTKIQRAMDQLLANYDAILAPTLNTEAGPVAQKFSEWSRGFVCTELTAAANVAGLPAITIPNGFGKRGLPTGIEFTGRALNENCILNAADAFQSATDWHTRHPTIE